MIARSMQSMPDAVGSTTEYCSKSDPLFHSSAPGIICGVPRCVCGVYPLPKQGASNDAAQI